MRTQFEKDAAWKRAKQIVEEKGYGDFYGGTTPSDLKRRLQPTNNGPNGSRFKTYYAGDNHDELWGMDVDGEELLKLAYGEKK